jgi:hypothetical protein
VTDRAADMTPAAVLRRIAQTLKQEIGPAVDAEYPRTQAFMAAVVLEKLGRQLALAAEHATAETADMTALVADLRERLDGSGVPAAVLDAADDVARTRDSAALCRLIEALYAARPALGEARFTALLGPIRRTLRRSIDRRLAVAR